MCLDAALKVTTEPLSRGNIIYIYIYICMCTYISFNMHSIEVKKIALLHSSSSYFVMNPLEKHSYIFNLVCYFYLKTAGKKFNEVGEQLLILSHSWSVTHSSHAFRAHINLVHLKQQIIKKEKKN